MEPLIYLDKEGLSALLTQAGPDPLAQTTRTAEKAQSSERSLLGRMRLPGLASLFGVGGETGGDLKWGRTYREEVVEQRGRRAERDWLDVRLALQQAGRLHTDLYAAKNVVQATRKIAFCDFVGRFVAVGWSVDDEQWWNRVREDQFVTLSLADDPELRLGMHFDKILGPHHLRERLRSGPVTLRILGGLELGKYLKPYAVSQPST
jgi:hypothetical protein